jgi:oligopeptide transport system substrate-binding protein
MLSRFAILLICIGAAGTALAENAVWRSNRGEPATLDPHKAANGWEISIAMEMFMGLTAAAADSRTIPGMAERWDMSADGLTYTFTLREGLTWSDGAPLVAEDFVYSFRRILDPATASPYASLWYPIRNAREVNTGALAPRELGVGAPDSRTVRIDLAWAAPYLPQLLIHRGLPVPRHAVERGDGAWLEPGTAVSNGAFLLSEWVSQTHLKLTPNPGFFDAANVKLDALYFVPTENLQTAMTMVRAGALDALSGFPPDRLAWIKANMPQYLRLHGLLGVEYYIFNLAKPPFDDPRVRRALSMALDRDAIAGKVLGTGETPAWSIVHPETMQPMAAHRPDFLAPPLAERRARATALLVDAGFGPRNPLRLTLRLSANDVVRKAAVAARAMWKEVGVEAKLESSDNAVLFTDIRSGNFTVGRADWYPEVIDPETYLYLLQSSSGPMNQSGYRSVEFDEAMRAAQQAPTANARLQALRAAEVIAARDQPLLPVFFYSGRTLVNPRVKGWIDHSRNTHPGRFLSVE